jgi:outer membrane biosynthesis protein TonB
MRISTAYFAGVGTVVMAIAAGLGGGYLAANVTNPPTQAVSKLERRMSAEPITVATAPVEPVPHVVATNHAAATAQEQTQPQQQTPQPQQQTPQPQQQTEAAAPSANNVRAEEKTANNVAVAQPIEPPPQPAKSTEQAGEKTAAPRDVFARARDADIKRADAEKRRAERRQRWADKRRFQQTREQELEAVEGSVREVTEPRRIRIREEAEPRDLFAERARSEMPRIRLFDQDN